MYAWQKVICIVIALLKGIWMISLIIIILITSVHWLKKWLFLTIKYYFSLSLSEIQCIICWFFVIMCAIYYQFLSENFFLHHLSVDNLF